MGKAKTRTKTNKDYYALLGVQPRSHARVIEESYWERAHDLHGVPTRKAQQRLGALNEAYEVLGTPHKRAEYDRYRGTNGDRHHHNGNGSSAAGGFLNTLVSILGKPFRPD
jgi:DnaJ-class molecular chaperone